MGFVYDILHQCCETKYISLFPHITYLSRLFEEMPLYIFFECIPQREIEVLRSYIQLSFAQILAQLDFNIYISAALNNNVSPSREFDINKDGDNFFRNATSTRRVDFFDTPDVENNKFDWAQMASLFFRATGMTEYVRVFQKTPIKFHKAKYLQPVKL